MVTYAATLDVPRHIVVHLSRLLAAHRRRLNTPVGRGSWAHSGRRSWCCAGSVEAERRTELEGRVEESTGQVLFLITGGTGALLAPAHTATYYARPGVAYVPFTDAEPVSYGLV